jgi:taurine---2-oxoglutarate transaminase
MSMTSAASSTTAEARRAYELDREYVFHSWSTQSELDPLVVMATQGSYVWDGSGKRYLDFSSQLVSRAIEFCPEAVVKPAR